MRPKLYVSIALLAFLALAACQAAAPTTRKPNVLLLTPPQGSTYVVGEEVAVQSAASDVDGITRVELYVDNNLVAQDSPPVAQGQTQFQVIQKWKANSAGSHTLTVRAFNVGGATADAGVVITVNAQAAVNVTTTTAPISTAVAQPVVTAPLVDQPPIAGTATPPPPTVCVFNSAFVRDVTVPDNTVLAPNQAFTKTWQVLNNGNCAWGGGLALVFVSGTALSSQNSIALPAVAPGSTAEISIPMQAPAQPNTYTSTWRMRDANGNFFGSNLTAVIVVPAPTNPPATNPPPPTAPLVDLAPFDGGQNLSINGEGTGVRILAAYTVSENTQIDHVDMFIMDGNGKIIDQHRENSAPYCYQGDTNGACNLWDFAQHGNKWHSGAPAREGLIFVRAVAYSKNGKMRVAEEPYWLDPSGNENFPPNIFIGLEQTGPDNTDNVLRDAIAFQVDIGNSSSFNVDHVDMFLVKYDGAILRKQTERSAPYCLFGDQNGQCNAYVFAEHNNTWPNGARIFPTMVILRAIVYAGNLPVAGLSQPVEIQ